MAGYYAHPSAIVEQGAFVGEGTKIWCFCHVMPGARIGKACNIGQGVFVGSAAEIGDRVKIQNNVSVYDRVVIEDDVFCGPSCVFTNVVNPRAFVERKTEFKETRIRRGATIGANATIVCGVVLGEYCFVGSGGVVTRDVRPFALVYGSPARQRGWVCRCGVKLGASLACEECGLRYAESGSDLVTL